MGNLKGKKILLGITGSIAAYKSCYLIREFIKQEAEVQCIATKSSLDFIGGISLSALSKNPVLTDINDEDTWSNHVELGIQSDVFLIAPATANTLAKASHGMCDNLLLACYLSAKCQVCWAPAMDLDMWKHPSTQSNIARLQEYGDKIIPVGNGQLASGLVGEGRMAETEDIVAFVSRLF